MNTYQQVVIMSVSKQLCDVIDIASTKDFARYLDSNKFSYNEAQGMYKGTSERSFVILIDSDYELELLKAIAMKYNQESILYQDSNGISQLLFTDGSDSMVTLGKLRQTETIDNLEAYTILKGKFYSIID